MNSPDDPLDPLLNRWTSTAEPAPRLASEVWRKIAMTESAPQATKGWWPQIEGCFAHPSFAVMFIAICMLTGLLFAELRVNNLQRERSAQLARSYLLLIDPLLNVPDIQSHP